MCSPDHTTNSAEPSVTNKKWVLSKRPNGVFSPDSDVKLVTERVALKCKDDEIIVETSMLSVDAFLRTMLDDDAYHGSILINSTMPAIGYGTVVHAGPGASQVKVGSVVSGMMGAQTFATLKASDAFRKFDFPCMSPTASLGLMGLTTGLTAYAGIFYVCRKPRRGETVVVTGAAGAVGSIAAQLAKSAGARVVGIAGGKPKQAFLLDNLKLDGAVDYKDAKRNLAHQLDECCPDGIDFVYDNVGGETLDALLERINPNGRVVICGAISQYSGNLNKGKVQGPSNYLKLAERGAEMKGFNVMQHMYKIPLMLFGMFWLYMRGKVHMTEHIENGIESFPLALQKLFTGGHIGKMLVNVKLSC